MRHIKAVFLVATAMASFNPTLVFGEVVGANQAGSAAELYFVDAHSQVDEDVGDFGLIIRRMDAAGVSRTILAARSGRKPGEAADFATQHPQRIIPSVRNKSGAFDKNP